MKTTRRKHERSITILALKDDGQGLIRITQDGKSTSYFIAPLPNSYGPSWTLEKIQGGKVSETYQVCLDDVGFPHCSCRGWERYGFCRHKEGLEALVKAGKLTCKV